MTGKDPHKEAEKDLLGRSINPAKEPASPWYSENQWFSRMYTYGAVLVAVPKVAIDDGSWL